jgi:hypothetical protein
VAGHRQFRGNLQVWLHICDIRAARAQNNLEKSAEIA